VICCCSAGVGIGRAGVFGAFGAGPPNAIAETSAIKIQIVRVIAATIEQMRLLYLAIVSTSLLFVGCAKKQQAADAKKPVPAATTPSDPQPEAAPAAAAAPAASEAPAPGSRGPVKKGGDPEDGGQ
jgi:hypothetical protein